jgi:two-component system sensor histidine kinase PilS (NtrC family)
MTTHRALHRQSEERRRQAWSALRLVFLYRTALVTALGVSFFSGIAPNVLGSSYAGLFGITVVVYLVFVLFSGMLLWRRSPGAQQQIQLALFVDILAITFLMHASGGVRSGLGLLIAVSIANGSLLMTGRQAQLFAALAALAVLTEQVYAHLSGNFSGTAYIQAGLLGATFFALALLAHGLSNRLHESELLARQRGLDLADLAQMNEYIIQHMTTGVLVVDGEGTIRLMNGTAWNLLGMPEASPGEQLERVLPALHRLLLAWQQDPHGGVPSLVQIQPGGRDLRPELTALGPAARAGTLIFLEDGARLEEQAQQMKLAALGRLTASIAHEIRNPLGAIGHAGQLLAESPELNSGDRRLTQIIKHNTLRVNDVIEAVLQLSRRKGVRPEWLDLSNWSAEFAAELERTRSLESGQIAVAIEPADLQVEVDPRQLRQVLGNLCDNALKYGRSPDRAPAIRLLGGLDASSGIPFLEVLDDGPGIAPEHQQQVFEPFFTTGVKGTGLGLYIARELCETNQVELSHVPQPEGGCCFRLRFRRWRHTADALAQGVAIAG